MNAHRLRAPFGDGALLADPPLGAVGAHLAENLDRLSRWDHDFQGRRVRWLRPLARRQALEKARGYLGRSGLDVPILPDASAPLVIAGHQPELYHPGVWVKNFATAAIAQARGGAGLNLIVDNDLAKLPAIRVPRLHDGGIQIQHVAYDEWGGDVPYEDLDVRNESFFATFDDRVRRMLAGAVADPMIEDYWPLVLRHREGDPRLGLRLARARRELEASWGVRNFEVPLGDLCENEAFLWFVAHLLAQLPRFQKVHNDALSRYRALYGIRSKNHPVAALRREGDWREAPFWIWRAEAPRRRSLWVRQLARTMELRIGSDGEPLMDLPLAPDREACCAVERLLTLPARRIRLRTRALTTTMFARLLLGDLFLHGIGGAKYDELGDEIVREFFGIEPPDFLTLSITLWLDLGIDRSATPERLHAVEHALRDLTFNPDRHLPDPEAPEARAWVEVKRHAIAGPAGTRRERRARHDTIRRCNEALQSLVLGRRECLDRVRAQILAGMRRNAVARNREYAFVLHSRLRLREAMARVQGG
ncbi:MAG: hypothetical protein JO329_00655 [Planctomycetaceae bacterium]|nr:hypothetical protein [Planctomycetaceae bacterium]